MTRVPTPKRNEQPISRFARFFKAYSLGLSLIVATLPLLISAFDLVPLFANTKNTVTIATSISSYLLVGFIFSQRRKLARIYFPGREVGKKRVAYFEELKRMELFNWLPLWFAILFVLLFLTLDYTVKKAVQQIAYEYAVEVPTENAQPTHIRDKIEATTRGSSTLARFQAFGQDKIIRIDYVQTTSGIECIVQFPDEESVRSILANTPSVSVPDQHTMALLFLCMFLLATSAFVLMGLQDYLQSELGISDRELITKPILPTKKVWFEVDTIPGIYGLLEYSPYTQDLEPRLEGPYCVWHDQNPQAADIDKTGKVTKWRHVNYNSRSKRISYEDCPLGATISIEELQEQFKRSGMNKFQQAFSQRKPID